MQVVTMQKNNALKKAQTAEIDVRTLPPSEKEPDLRLLQDWTARERLRLAI
jgi:hypothetical protein